MIVVMMMLMRRRRRAAGTDWCYMAASCVMCLEPGSSSFYQLKSVDVAVTNARIKCVSVVKSG